MLSLFQAGLCSPAPPKSDSVFFRGQKQLLGDAERGQRRPGEAERGAKVKFPAGHPELLQGCPEPGFEVRLC